MNQEIFDIITLNNKCRQTGSDTDLFTIDTLEKKEISCSSFIVMYKYYQFEFISMSQNEYNKTFNKILPIAYELLNSVTNIVVAGGAANKILSKINHNINNDVDIFIYDIHSMDVYWAKVTEICSFIVTKYNNGAHKIIQKIKQGVISIFILNILNKTILIEYQIILKLYNSISELLHSFDIGCCCIAFTGKTTYVTSLGKYSLEYGINPVYIPYKTKSYEFRLHKYFTRGFGLEFINIKPEFLFDRFDTDIYFKYFIIVIIKKIKQFIYICHVKNINIDSNIYDEYYCDDVKYMKYRDIITYPKILHLMKYMEFCNIILNDTGTVLDYSYIISLNTIELYNYAVDCFEFIELFVEKLSNIIFTECIFDIIDKLEIPIDLITDIIKIGHKYDKKYIYTNIHTIFINYILKHVDRIPEWIYKFDVIPPCDINEMIIDWYANDQDNDSDSDNIIPLDVINFYL